MVANETMTAKGVKHIIQGGPSGANWRDFCEVRKVKVAVQCGEFITSASETAGDPLDLAAAGDEDTGTVELVVKRVGCIPQDIATEIVTSSYVLALQQGSGFEVAAYRTDASTAILKGQKMGLGASGLTVPKAYTDSTEATDFHLFVFTLTQDSADVASLNPVIFGKF